MRVCVLSSSLFVLFEQAFLFVALHHRLRACMQAYIDVWILVHAWELVFRLYMCVSICAEMFVSPSKDRAQCKHVQRKLQSFREQNDKFVGGCYKFVMNPFCFQSICLCIYGSAFAFVSLALTWTARAQLIEQFLLLCFPSVYSLLGLSHLI